MTHVLLVLALLHPMGFFSAGISDFSLHKNNSSKFKCRQDKVDKEPHCGNATTNYHFIYYVILPCPIAGSCFTNNESSGQMFVFFSANSGGNLFEVDYFEV